jgi:hypothetical protein
VTAQAQVKSHWLAWLAFLILGGGMWYARYGHGLPQPYAAWLPLYGPYVVIVIHIIITLTAFQDTVFQGILCVLIPLYSFYYLFLISDAFFLRAIAAGLLVGIGQDSAIFFQRVANEVINNVNAWIAAGGGSPKNLPK